MRFNRKYFSFNCFYSIGIVAWLACSSSSQATASAPLVVNYSEGGEGEKYRGPPKGSDDQDVQAFYDPTFDYSRFPARITDKNLVEKILKFKTENNNVKFLRVGDEFFFQMHGQEHDPCRAFVRGVEGEHFSAFVTDMQRCWPDQLYRLGSQVHVHSPILTQRTYLAAQFRVQLLKSKQDYLQQLNSVNHFIWGFDQIRVKRAGQFDQKIMEIREQKQKALEDMLTEKKEKLVLQSQLIRRLDELEAQLNHYRIEGYEYHTDRWSLDHDLGMPMGYGPQEEVLK